MKLEDMSRDELEQLRKDVDKALGNLEARRKAEARAALEAEAKAHGFALRDLIDVQPSGKKKAVITPKYRHPENPELTWSGRGRRPQWFIEALAGGRSPEDFAVE